MPDLCNYAGTDTTAAITGNDDGTYRSNCHCGTVTMEAGSYDEAVDALVQHRLGT